MTTKRKTKAEQAEEYKQEQERYKRELNQRQERHRAQREDERRTGIEHALIREPFRTEYENGDVLSLHDAIRELLAKHPSDALLAEVISRLLEARHVKKADIKRLEGELREYKAREDGVRMALRYQGTMPPPFFFGR